jgi:hypothetical protein
MNFKNPVVNLSPRCLCLGLVHVHAMGMFCLFCTACDAIIFAVATNTTIYSSSDRRYGPLRILSSSDFYKQDALKNVNAKITHL